MIKLKKAQKWLTEKELPTIRKTNAYIESTRKKQLCKNDYIQEAA